jgi:hypothetical protein
MPPYTQSMMQIGRSGCAAASLCSICASSGRWSCFHSARPLVLVESTLEACKSRDGLVLSSSAVLGGSDVRNALSMLMLRGICDACQLPLWP